MERKCLLVLGCVISIGCAGQVNPAATDEAGDGPVDRAGASGTSGPKTPVGKPDSPTAFETAALDSYPLMRLTPSQHSNIILDVLGVKDVGATALVKAQPTDLNVSPRDLVNGYDEWSEKAAQSAGGTGGKLALYCGTDTGTCGARMVKEYGPLLFRRPLAADEIAGYAKVYAESLELGSAAALSATLQAMLMSPSFTMMVETPVGSNLRLPAHQLAARLAIVFWDSGPDADLLAAAAAGQLDDKTGLSKTVDRMMASPKFGRFVARLFDGWLGYAKVATTDKDDAIKAAFTPAVAAAMERETQLFTTSVYNDTNSDFRQLLTSNKSYINQDLAKFYGLKGTFSTDFVATDMSASGPRSGVLTQGSVLTTLALPTRGSIVLRGVHILERFLCAPPPPPPDVPDLPSQGANRPTQRERLAEHRKSPVCASCHKSIDGAGLAFEVFDAVGRFTPTENGVALDGSGELPEDESGNTQAYKGVGELGKLLSERRDVKYCFLNHWFEHSLNRKPTKNDVRALTTMATRFVESNNMRQLLTDFVLSDSFQTFR